LKTKISKDDCPTTPNENRKQTYLQIIGSIIFGFTHCRLDLAFPVGMLTRVMHSPSETHLKQLIDLLKYINATMKWGLNFFRDHTVRYGMDFIFLDFAILHMVMIRRLSEALADISFFFVRDKHALAQSQDKHLILLSPQQKQKLFGHVVQLPKELLSSNSLMS
jgi:hypothetical protein